MLQIYSFVSIFTAFIICAPLYVNEPSQRITSVSTLRSVPLDTPPSYRLPDLRKFLQDTNFIKPLISTVSKCKLTSGSWSGKLTNLVGQDSFDLTLVIDNKNNIVEGNYIFYHPYNDTDSLEPFIYSMSGFLRNDSLFFRTDSIYEFSWAKEYKGNYIKRRFSCACLQVEWSSRDSLGSQQYLVGEYIDSSFMYYPMFGYFILKNKTSW